MAGADSLYTIEFLLDSGESKTLNFYPFVEADPSAFYKVTASGYPYTFTLAKRTWNGSVLLSREEYLPN